MFRVRVSCRGLSEEEGKSAPNDILEEFRHRPWHRNPASSWDDGALWLETENDYDDNGLALLDEFQDAVVAWVPFKGDIRFAVESVEVLKSNDTG